jgi:hypothetical protein
MVIDIGCLYRKDTEDGMTAITTADSALNAQRILFLNGMKEMICLSYEKCVFGEEVIQHQVYLYFR